MFQFLNESKYITLFVILFVFYLNTRRKEGFENKKIILNSNEKELVKEKHIEEIPIIPPMYDNTTRTIMSGSDYIPSEKIVPAWGEIENLDDGANGKIGLHNSMCSPSCCTEQWPISHMMPADSMVCGSQVEYVPSNYKCSNSWQNAGCLCLTKQQATSLNTRGANA